MDSTPLMSAEFKDDTEPEEVDDLILYVLAAIVCFCVVFGFICLVAYLGHHYAHEYERRQFHEESPDVIRRYKMIKLLHRRRAMEHSLRLAMGKTRGLKISPVQTPLTQPKHFPP